LSAPELVSLVTCDLGAIVRGRAVLSSEPADLEGGVSWVPANQALTPLGPLAEPSPFDSTGDLRLIPDGSTRIRVGSVESGQTPLELVICDVTELDGSPWACCPRDFLRRALTKLHEQTGTIVRASFEHEFQLLREEPPALPFSLEAQRLAEPFATNVMRALVEAGVKPERFFPEYASHQFEVPVAPAEGLQAADRAVILREVVREVARREGRRATFTPLLDPAEAGNGVHVHLSLRDGDGMPVLFDPPRPGDLSELGGSFAAGVLEHAGALTALCAPSVISAERLYPHHWSAGAVCLGLRNRETLLRIPPLLHRHGEDTAAGQMRLEYRGVDAAANPYLALGSIVLAGLSGIERGHPAPELLDRDPSTLESAEAERFGVGGLPGSLQGALDALAADEDVRGWLGPLLYDAYVSVKQAELAVTAELPLQERCRRYALAY
jgi:glutamine synthetase